MHCNIYEVSRKPIAEEDRMSEFNLPDGFLGSVADSLNRTTGEERDMALQLFTILLDGKCTVDGDELHLDENFKESYFADKYSAFQGAVSELGKIDFETFIGNKGTSELPKAVRSLNDATADKFSHYIYDKDYEELSPIDSWLRFADPDARIYFGTVLDYHY